MTPEVEAATKKILAFTFFSECCPAVMTVLNELHSLDAEAVELRKDRERLEVVMYANRIKHLPFPDREAIDAAMKRGGGE